MSAMTSNATLQGFLESTGILFRRNALLSSFSTWRIGGPADFIVQPADWHQVALVLEHTSENGIPTVVIGKGSDLLFDDAGLRGIVVKIGRELSRFTVSGTTVRAESGISASRLARTTGQAGLSGLEHIVGIPGTLGGLVVMNGGSLRNAIGDVITEVQTVDQQGKVETFGCEGCEFAYRQSKFQDGGRVVAKVTMELMPGQPTTILGEMLTILRKRRAKFPLTMPNCGSVFRSDPELYSAVGSPGRIIEKLGLKGRRIGGAQISTKHANFIVNTGNATAANVMDLIRLVVDQSKRVLGVHLCSEVIYVRANGVQTAPTAAEY